MLRGKRTPPWLPPLPPAYTKSVSLPVYVISREENKFSKLFHCCFFIFLNYICSLREGHMEARGELVGVCPFLPSCGSFHHQWSDLAASSFVDPAVGL